VIKAWSADSILALGQRSPTAGEQHQGAVVHPSVDQAGLAVDHLEKAEATRRDIISSIAGDRIVTGRHHLPIDRVKVRRQAGAGRRCEVVAPPSWQ
jgi:hypothetical protein